VTSLGDSGGPVFEGALSENGPIVAVNSGVYFDFLFGWSQYPAYPIHYYQRILAFIHSDYNLPPGWESSTDRAGADFESSSQPDLFACVTRCANNVNCKAMSFVTSTGRCYLKDALRSPSRKKGVMTLVMGGRNVVEAGYNRNGHVYDTVDSTGGCPLACAKESKCTAWNSRTFNGQTHCDLIDTVGGGQSSFIGGWNYTAPRGGMQYFKRLTTGSAPYLTLYYGENWLFGQQLPSIYSERHCQAVCARDSSCRFWVYDWSDRASCALHRTASTGVTSAETVVSGQAADVALSNRP
jgi:hypothetical protein